MKQRTLAASFSLRGKGLHTGLDLTVTFCPAPENHGYKIQRVDLEGTPVIDAVAENVVETTRGTVLGVGEARCSTVEHAFGAMYAFGIDNVLVQVDGPEFPILDGSASLYVEKIHEVGIVEQESEKNWLTVTEPIEFKDESTGSHIMLLPADDFAVSVTIDFNSKMMPIQTATLRELACFEKEISAARTFVFVREIEPLLSLGLIKGGDLDNAIVIYERQTTQENMDKLCKLHDLSLLRNDMFFISFREIFFLLHTSSKYFFQTSGEATPWHTTSTAMRLSYSFPRYSFSPKT